MICGKWGPNTDAGSTIHFDQDRDLAWGSSLNLGPKNIPRKFTGRREQKPIRVASSPSLWKALRKESSRNMAASSTTMTGQTDGGGSFPDRAGTPAGLRYTEK